MTGETGRPLVAARGVIKVFGEGALAAPVLKGISLTLTADELVLVMGPSGSGKTTLISILAGLMRPSEGEVELCGTRISGRPEAVATQVRREHVGFIFQHYNLFPALTAHDNVAEVLRLKGMERNEARRLARNVLEKVGLGERLHSRPGELSGGQKQRVAIARALAHEPALIIGDEVTAALDSETGMSVMNLLRRHVTPGRSVVIVTHDHRLEHFADRVVEIEDGRILRVRGGHWKQPV
ncbi:ABC transporter ATP-binding protein [Archangium gephyra]|uniref:ABC transporter ATP-binding protein n=1 Tax=Archangium gephyra TaxID=48 RepID=UPI0035D3F1B9